jgi:hypothetical protein
MKTVTIQSFLCYPNVVLSKALIFDIRIARIDFLFLFFLDSHDYFDIFELLVNMILLPDQRTAYLFFPEIDAFGDSNEAMILFWMLGINIFQGSDGPPRNTVHTNFSTRFIPVDINNKVFNFK